MGVAIFRANRRTDRHDEANCRFAILLFCFTSEWSSRCTLHFSVSKICVLLQIYWSCIETPVSREPHVMWSDVTTLQVVVEHFVRSGMCRGLSEAVWPSSHGIAQVGRHVLLSAVSPRDTPPDESSSLSPCSVEDLLRPFLHNIFSLIIGFSPAYFANLERTQKRSCASICLWSLFRVENRWV